ncbi:MAG TPA: hypothetical protein PKH79_01665 [Prolixibacteraceae bacterium]|nr:hypothetical protein [Prolixibacteraceae bacterium]HPS13026.1 hypothetical protein [Prolixibacteraceae bacterium]
MAEKIFQMGYKGHRSLTPENKRYYTFLGIGEIAVGSICLLLSVAEQLTPVYLCLLMLGIFSLVYAMIGKYWAKEKNYIAIGAEQIEFMNLSQKPKVLSIKDLDDIVIEENKAMFVTKDKHFHLYDYSIFNQVQAVIVYKELLKLSLTLVKKK